MIATVGAAAVSAAAVADCRGLSARLLPTAAQTVHLQAIGAAVAAAVIGVVSAAAATAQAAAQAEIGKFIGFWFLVFGFRHKI